MNLLLIGKPNVGKSSIYNILTGTNSNIIHKTGGTTRDWHEKKIKKIPDIFIFDTPGILFKKNSTNFFQTTSIFKSLLNKIDMFLYVVDYSSIFNLIDNNFINEFRKFNKEIILLINKFDYVNQTPNAEFYKYGIKNEFFLSCSHQIGFDVFHTFLKKEKPIKKNNKFLSHDFTIAIFGKPNAGKSTLLNTILGYERSVTSTIAGTTSDIVEDYFIFENNIIKIIDTAGIGRKSNVIKKSINFYSIKKSFEKIKKVDSVFIIIDSQEGIDKQDKRIIDIVTSKAKSIIIIFNKIDLIHNQDKYKQDTLKDIKYTLHQMKNIKVFFCTAFSKNHINKILSYILKNIFHKYYLINTSKPNTWLKKAVSKQQHPLIDNKKVNFKYAVQVKVNPVTIKIFCNFSHKLKKDYKRFLNNNFNSYFKILNQKTVLIFSTAKNPFL